MASIFSKIIAGEIPCYKVAENDSCFAFLDINPVTKGHVLCIPKQEVDYLFDLDEKSYCELQAFTRRVAKAVKEVCPCTKVGVAVLGLEVPHAHIHLIPLQTEGDMDFHKHIKMEQNEFVELAKAIAEKFE